MGRLTCEKTTSNPSCPVVGDATLRNQYTYSNGESLPSQWPGPDNIVYAAWKNSAQTSPSIGMYHDSASNKLNAIAVDPGTGPRVNYFHDGQGRRLQDEDSQYGNEARTYTYLPNGKIATIQGKRAVEWYTDQYLHATYPYTISFAYDHRGRPVSITYTETGSVTPGGPIQKDWYPYWDSADRLIGVRHYPTGTSGSLQRWSYAYAGSERVAAVLEDVNGATTTTYKLWYLNDALGVPLETIDGTTPGSIVVRERQEVESYGWSNKLVSWAGKWMPFVLPGQLVFNETTSRAFANVCAVGYQCPQYYLRPPIAWHGARLYDPLVGAFTSPDPLVRTYREGSAQIYGYAAGDPVRRVDPSGLYPSFYGCSDRQVADLEKAWLSAYFQINLCGPSGCGKFDVKAWKDGMRRIRIDCVDEAVISWRTGEGMEHMLAGTNGRDTMLGNSFWTTACERGGPLQQCKVSGGMERSGTCLERMWAHESLHVAYTSGEIKNLAGTKVWKQAHRLVPDAVEACVGCSSLAGVKY